MTMHADQLVGAPVIDSDGRGVGTVEQVFRDDVDGTPSWARIRSARGLHFVPLAGGKVTGNGGLSVAFDEQKILREPDINVDRHMSVDQEEELRRYFGLAIPAQAGAPEAEGPGAGPGAGAPEAGGPGQAGAPGAAETRVDQKPPSVADQPVQQWMIRSEERFSVNLETHEASRVRLRKYVETEPVEQTVKVFHEEYEIERVPIAKDDQVGADLAEGEQEIILREARAIITKESVPVERIRLAARKVEEDKTVRDELRRERIEVLGDDGQPVGSPTDSSAGQPTAGHPPQ